MEVPLEIYSICNLGEDELDNEQFEAAAKHCKDAVNRAEDAASPGPTHRETLLLRDRWAMGLHKAGHYEKIIGLDQESLRRRLCSSAFGPTHEETLDNRRQLAATYSELGNLEAAVDEYREVELAHGNHLEKYKSPCREAIRTWTQSQGSSKYL